MATSSLLGGTKAPEEISGKDIASLGPSDTSDSGSDAVGAYGADELASDTDSSGTGERAAVEEGADEPESNVDILPDHIELAPGSTPPEASANTQHSVQDRVEALTDRDVKRTI